MLFNAAVAFLSGMIWDKIGPQYVFLTFIVLELGIRLPLLVSVPETLNSQMYNQTGRSAIIKESRD